ncbi:hypothetical protein [Pontibacter akesuensis]|uniref:hypothetical protein n=1 Tax=Pontibacter akesuensis TaxID=388950 RepID=UPI001114006A|nr:hypothetical protein [Pontibacter akesuensis]
MNKRLYAAAYLKGPFQTAVVRDHDCLAYALGPDGYPQFTLAAFQPKPDFEVPHGAFVTVG